MYIVLESILNNLNLHSTLVLLKAVATDVKLGSTSLFTFYSSSIKGAVTSGKLLGATRFTFYSSSIKGLIVEGTDSNGSIFTFYSSSIKGNPRRCSVYY